MRTILVLAVLAVAGAVLGIMVVARGVFRSEPTPPSAEAGTAPVPSPPPVPARNVNQKPARGPGAAPPPVAAAVDPDSPEGILAALESPDPEVRAEALARAKQVEDRSIVPRLQDLAERTEDAREKAAILAAIDYINLPSVTEVQAPQRSNRVARGLPPPPRAATNRYTGKTFIVRPQPPATPGHL